MAQTRLKIEVDGREPFIVDTTQRDARRWEAFTGLSSLRDLDTLTGLTQLGGFTAIREGKFDGSIEEFMAVVVDVTGVAETESPDFTPADPTETLLSPSPSEQVSG